ncbi:glycosyltransferase family 2 protein [Candidatus Leptofilum sp.]|uniref:glycosyltransferase family 2 protein n=1 Tax=Candidatus Leptofilum sp. TaxID=3241576 RepID=UPI003B58DC76
MKLIIQIPCYNEAESLPQTVSDLPTHVPGIDCIETLVIDDGSTDGTADVAHSLGIDHVVQHRQNMGLARAFQTGLDAALRLGADIIVNTDADNQYPGRYIPGLVAPVLAGKADIVIANRQIDEIVHFSLIKKVLQKLGSWTVRTVSGTDVPDAVSGFRAYSRDTALRLNILTNFSYTLDTIIQAGKQGLIIESIPVDTNGPIRPSRLQRSMGHFIKAQASTILRLYAFYEPLRTFTYIALPFILTGLYLWGRFFYTYLTRASNQFIQSVTIGTGLLLVGLFIFLFGVQADITSKHRQMTQETLYRLKKLELDQNKNPQINTNN